MEDVACIVVEFTEDEKTAGKYHRGRRNDEKGRVLD